MTRRLLGAVGAAAAVAVLAVPAAAQERIDSGEWSGSRVEPPPAVTTDPGAATVQGVFKRDEPSRPPRVTVTVNPPKGGLPPGCPHAAPRSGEAVVAPNDDGISPIAWGFSWVAPFGPGACNGTYPVHIVADVLGDNDPRLTTSIDVAVPPPPVDDVVAEAGPARTVKISWTPTANPTPDFLGYHVIRSAAGSDPATTFAVDDPGASSFTDDQLPAEGGTFEYRVVGRRAGPHGEVTSSGGEADDPVDVSAAPAPDTGDDDGDGDDAGDGSGAASASRPGRSGLSGRGSSGSSRVSPPATGPPTTLDTGFDEMLPFGDREPGAEDAVLPTGDETASMIYEDLPGRGLAIPVATGLVLAVWAFHLRYLARAARPPA